jgi:opacity protein-like surface antigen
MKKFLIGLAVLVAAANSAISATAVNNDAEPRTLIVTEGGDRSEVSLAGGETITFCAGGCFVTLPNGDREALTGSETIEITDGVARIR